MRRREQTNGRSRSGRSGRALLRALLACGALAVASCGAAGEPARPLAQSAPAQSTSAAPAQAHDPTRPTQMWVDGGADGVVIVRSGPQLVVYDTATLAPLWRSDHAVLSADRLTAVSSVPSASGGTTVEVVDVREGRVRRAVALPQAREVAAVSSTGLLAALVDRLTLDPATGMPIGRERSVIDVLDLTTGTTVRSLALAGNLVPESFDLAGGVAVIQYVPAEKPARYRVRTLDAKTGHISNVLTRDKTEIVDEMQGYGRAAIAKVDGSALFTLYRDGGRWGSAFVHQLVGEGQFAFCIDLPERGFDDASAIALGPEERELYVAGADGAVAVIDARENFGVLPAAVKQILWVPGITGTPGALAVTADAVWLVIDGQLVVADRTTGERTDMHAAPGATAVAVSSDGLTRVVTDAANSVRRL